MLALITIDLEDWFQVENLRPIFPHEVWNSCEYRVEKSTDTLLRLFDEKGIKATFFVLGWVAERSPSLIRRIVSEGHEVASHGHDHSLLNEKDQSGLRKDISRSKALLEDIIGMRVLGYRAPSFTISNTLLMTLKELGFLYDSSLNDFGLHGRYGRLDLEGFKRVEEKGGFYKLDGILEIPVTNLRLGQRQVIPWAGGGYFRLIPGWIFNQGIRQILRKKGHYVFYCHPWEFDPSQPRIRELRWDRRFRHYVGIKRTLTKLERLLDNLHSMGAKFTTCMSAL